MNVLRQSNVNLLGLTQGKVDICLISVEGQLAIYSQLDSGAVRALVPLTRVKSAMPRRSNGCVSVRQFVTPQRHRGHSL